MGTSVVFGISAVFGAAAALAFVAFVAFGVVGEVLFPAGFVVVFAGVFIAFATFLGASSFIAVFVAAADFVLAFLTLFLASTTGSSSLATFLGRPRFLTGSVTVTASILGPITLQRVKERRK